MFTRTRTHKNAIVIKKTALLFIGHWTIPRVPIVLTCRSTALYVYGFFIFIFRSRNDQYSHLSF